MQKNCTFKKYHLREKFVLKIKARFRRYLEKKQYLWGAEMAQLKKFSKNSYFDSYKIVMMHAICSL